VLAHIFHTIIHHCQQDSINFEFLIMNEIHGLKQKNRTINSHYSCVINNIYKQHETIHTMDSILLNKPAKIAQKYSRVSQKFAVFVLVHLIWLDTSNKHRSTYHGRRCWHIVIFRLISRSMIHYRTNTIYKGHSMSNEPQSRH